MKIKVNYTIQDMFKHNQQITAEKDNPRYLDFIMIIDKMARLEPYDYVLFIELEDDNNPLKYLTVYYDNMADLKDRTLTVEYHSAYNTISTCKTPTQHTKKWLSDYMKDNGLWEQ